MNEIKFTDYDEVFLQKSWDWLNDPEMKYLTQTSTFSKEGQLDWFNTLQNRSDYKIWGVMADSEPVGAFGLKNITGYDAEYWGYIGNKAYWGRGIGVLMVKKAIERAKEQGLCAVYLKVIRENKRAIHLYEKTGFECFDEENEFLLMKVAIS